MTNIHRLLCELRFQRMDSTLMILSLQFYFQFSQTYQLDLKKYQLKVSSKRILKTFLRAVVSEKIDLKRKCVLLYMLFIPLWKERDRERNLPWQQYIRKPLALYIFFVFYSPSFQENRLEWIKTRYSYIQG